MDWDDRFAFRVREPTDRDLHPYLLDVADDLGLTPRARTVATGTLGNLPVTVELGGSAQAPSATASVPLPPGTPIGRGGTRPPLSTGHLGVDRRWLLQGEPTARAMAEHPALVEALAAIPPVGMRLADGRLAFRVARDNVRRAAAIAARTAVTVGRGYWTAWQETVVDVIRAHGLDRDGDSFAGDGVALRLDDDAWTLVIQLPGPLPPGIALRHRQNGDPAWGDAILDHTLGLNRPNPGLIDAIRTQPPLRDALIALLHPRPQATASLDTLWAPIGDLPTGADLALLLADARTVRAHWPR